MIRPNDIPASRMREAGPIPTSAHVVVLGCGLMGAALARTFAAHGLTVTVWNRTHERARALERPRISAVEDVTAAVRTSRLVVACTDTVASLRASADPIEDWHGATVANLVSTTPRQAEETAAWVADRHGTYLDGAVMCYPAEVGTSAGHFLYSGTRARWAEHRAILSALGPSTFSDASASMASALMAGISSFYTPALTAYVDAATYLRDQGASSADILEVTGRAIGLLSRHAARGVDAIASGDYATDQATIQTFATSIRDRLPDLQASGRRMRVLDATLETLDEAQAAGLGHLDIFALSSVV